MLTRKGLISHNWGHIVYIFLEGNSGGTPQTMYYATKRVGEESTVATSTLTSAV